MGNEFVTIAATPIPGESPGGIEARYEPEYSTLLEEIDKLTALGSNAVCNWQVVRNMGLLILKEKSKDFQVACYTANAFSKLHGLEGMADGCELLNVLCKTYWETGFPTLKRMRRRINAFTWWRECTEALLQTALDETPSTMPFPSVTVDHLRTVLHDLDETLGELMPDFPPLRALMQQVDRLPVSTPTPEAEPVEETATANLPERESADHQSPAPLATATSKGEGSYIEAPLLGERLQDNLSTFSRYALQLANIVLCANHADSFGWQLSRFALWGRLHNLPPAQGRQTAIPAPPLDLKEAVHNQLNARRYPQAALAAQDLFLTNMWWLDAQYLAAQALENCGPEFANALQVVNGEVEILLRRLPGVEELTFDDGTPFADDSTRAWLRALTSRSDVSEESSPVLAAVDEARGLFFEGRKTAALDRLDQEFFRVRETTDRLMLRMEQCRLLIRAEQWVAATALADELMTVYKEQHMDKWSVKLAMENLIVIRQAWDGLGGERGVAKAREVTGLMALLRPSTVLE